MSKAETRANVRRDLIIAVELMQLWRLCAKPGCRRARACRGDPCRCAEGLADWGEALSMMDKRVGLKEAVRHVVEQETPK